MQRPLSIVIPVFNEEEILEVRVAGLLEDLSDFEPLEVILSENGSIDGTKEIARQLDARYDNVRAVIDPGPPDYGVALRNGINTAAFDEVAILEVDYLDLDFLRHGYELLDKFELVIGSKKLSPGIDQRPARRRIFTWLYNTLLRMLFRLPLTETHGLKVLRKGPLSAITNGCVTSGAVYPSEFVLRAHRAGGVSVTEIPLVMPLREVRATRINARKRLKKTMEDLLVLRRALRTDAVAASSAAGVREKREGRDTA